MSGSLININDLWIGDKLYLIKEEKVGVFEGQNVNGDLKVKVEGKLVLTKLENINYFKEIEPEIDLVFNDDVHPLPKKPGFEKKSKLGLELDLHIEKLKPELMNADAATIVDFQLESCKRYLNDAIAQKIHRVTIIHGKGEGKLKDYVHALLSSYAQVRWKILINKDGATEVWLQ